MMEGFLLILLFIIELICFLYLYSVNRGDMLSPSVATVFLFMISMGFAIIGNLNGWHKNFLPTTFIFVLASTFTIIISEKIAKMSVAKKLNERRAYFFSNRTEPNLKYINIGKFKKNLLVFASFILTVWYVYSIIKLGKDNVNFLAKQGIKVTMAIAYIYTFIFTNNIFVTKNIKKEITLTIPFFCGCICSFFTGVRTEILRLLLAFFVYFFVLFQERGGWKNKDISFTKLIKKITLPICLFLILFFFMRTYIKSDDIGENLHYGILMYLAFYIGSPWIVLNQKILLGLDSYRGNMWGHLTLGILWDDLVGMGFISTPIKAVKTFTSLDSILQVNGNADTMLGSPLIDFGFFGALIVIFIFYYYLSKLYYKKIKYTESSKKRNYWLIIYAFLFYVVGISFYACGITFILSLYYLLTMFLIWIIYNVYFRLKI